MPMVAGAAGGGWAGACSDGGGGRSSVRQAAAGARCGTLAGSRPASPRQAARRLVATTMARPPAGPAAVAAACHTSGSPPPPRGSHLERVTSSRKGGRTGWGMRRRVVQHRLEGRAADARGPGSAEGASAVVQATPSSALRHRPAHVSQCLGHSRSQHRARAGLELALHYNSVSGANSRAPAAGPAGGAPAAPRQRSRPNERRWCTPGGREEPGRKLLTCVRC